MRVRVPVAALLAMLGGCGSVTEIVVRVDSDIAIGAPLAAGAPERLAALEFVLQGLAFGTPIADPEPDPAFQSCLTLAAGDCLPAELGIVADGDWVGKDLGIELRGRSDCGASPGAYLYQRARVSFSEGRVTLLPLRLQGGCYHGQTGTSACGGSERCSASGGCEPIPAPVALASYAPQQSCL